MATAKITVRRTTEQRDTLQFVTLEGIRIGLHHRYSAFEQCWYQWLVQPDGVEFAGPIKLVQSINLWRPFQYDPRVPPGECFVHGDEATLETIDVTSFLLYRETS